jgi:hypothetical protein
LGYVYYLLKHYKEALIEYDLSLGINLRLNKSDISCDEILKAVYHAFKDQEQPRDYRNENRGRV